MSSPVEARRPPEEQNALRRVKDVGRLQQRAIDGGVEGRDLRFVAHECRDQGPGFDARSRFEVQLGPSASAALAESGSTRSSSPSGRNAAGHGRCGQPGRSQGQGKREEGGAEGHCCACVSLGLERLGPDDSLSSRVAPEGARETSAGLTRTNVRPQVLNP